MKRPTLHPEPLHRRRIFAVLAFTGLALATLTFAALALAARSSPYFAIDLQITRALQSYRPEWLNLFMKVVSWPGFPPQVDIMVAVIIVLLFLAVSRWKAVSFAFASAGATLQIVIKVLVDRPRPSPALVHVTDTNLGDASFPAGHAVMALILFGFFWYLAYTAKKMSLWRTLTLIGLGAFIILTGPSRIYEGGHWFSDVVAGYLLGSIWLIVTIYFYEWGKKRFEDGRASSSLKAKKRQAG
jgi:undecaprenyl-diphosphatase